MIVGNRHHSTRGWSTDNRLDFFDPNRKRANENQLVDRHLNTHLASCSVQVGGNLLDTVTCQLRIKLRKFLRIKRRPDELLTLQTR